MVATAIRRALADALAFVLPVECAGCGAEDVALCEACEASLVPTPTERRIDGLTVASGLRFEAEPARIVRALKEEGRTALARHLAPALAAALARLDRPDALIVPVPTSAASMRRRGYRVPELLLARAGIRSARVLRPTRVTGDQRGLSAAERFENTRGSMTARGVAGRHVIVVDDVVTTGATLVEAARALRAAGAVVRGAATVAATPRRSDDRRQRTAIRR